MSCVPLCKAGNSQVKQSITPAITLRQPVLLQGQQVYVAAPVSTVGNMLRSATPTPPSTPNTNPFYVRFIAGNIRICQGCRSILRCADGSVPAPPFDLCVAHAECHSFRDATGILRTPQKEQPAHYHLNILCIRALATDFVPSSIIVPPDVLPSLGQVHKELLRLVFGIFT